MNRFKKIAKPLLILICILFTLGLFLESIPFRCGCDETYMGATLVSYGCDFVGDEMVFRQCVYEY